MAHTIALLALLTSCATGFRHNVKSHSSKVGDTALPPGFEDELYCPPGYCMAPKDVEDGMTGPRTMFWECRDESGEKDPEPVEAWGGQLPGAESKKEELLASEYHDKQCEVDLAPKTNPDLEDMDENIHVDPFETPEIPTRDIENTDENTENMDEGMDEDMDESMDDDVVSLESPEDAEDMDPKSGSVSNDQETNEVEDTDGGEETDEVDESGSSEGPKGTKITLEGFPQDINGVHRGSLNGVYFEDVNGDCDVQGHPTYWQKEFDNGDTPFIYYCATNSTTKLSHKKWAISSKSSWGKIKDGKCESFAPFPPKQDLHAGLHVEFIHLGFDENGDKGWANPNDKLWAIRISSVDSIEPTDEVPSGNCAA